ncbi:MAG: OmpA family protein [Ignavibacteriae bacterium]|nr:OmpA family protein [Ignavibacteriota bacterium]
MKKILLFCLFISNLFFAQTVIDDDSDSIRVYKTSWYLGGGLSYPRYMTISDKSIASHKNFGAYLTLGYNLTEHFGFRLTPSYVLLHSFYYGNFGGEIDNYVNMGAINLEALYSLLPCEIISPYVLLGYGMTYFKSTNPYLGEIRKPINDAWIGYQALLGLGAEFKFFDDLSIKAEFDYITASNNKIDGNDHINEVKGMLYSNGDSYMNLKLGAVWYFDRGERSRICEPFSIREVIREVPVEKIVVDTVYIDKVIEKAVTKRESFVLENVKFKFDKDELTEESKAILNNVANTLNRFPDEKIEILGHTDNIGSDEYNLDLSERRANSVKNYLVTRGVVADRLYTAGCGERKPVADNDTEIGRAINRRIEFSIYDGISSKCPKPEEGGIQQNESEFEKAVLNNEQVIIEGVFFKFDSDQLTPESENTLTNVANVLQKYPDANVEIQGHTDSLGNNMYNEFLSDKRAKSVKNFLVKKGINESRLTTIGYGETKPIEDNGTSYGRAVNRRIEFNIKNSSNIKVQTAKPVKTDAVADQFTTKEEKEIAQIIASGEKLVFTNIHFRTNSDIITKSSLNILDNAANVLSKMSDVNVEIQGHTDSDGSENYNQILSEKRAIAVKNYLVQKGISADRLTTKGFGETKPISDNSTKEGKAQNRRIEFEIIK